MNFFKTYQFKRKMAELSVWLQTTSRKALLKYRFFQYEFYDFSKSANIWFRIASILLTALVFLSVGLPYFTTDEHLIDIVNNSVEQFILLSFGLLFFIRLFVEQRPIQFFKTHWLEGIAALFALILSADIFLDSGFFINYLFDLFGIEDPAKVMLNLVQFYLIGLVIIKVVQFIPKIIATTRNPARLILTSFILAILAGAILLMLPEATTNKQGLAFIDALFMSASAVCVTGLAVVDAATQLSFFGQTVILVLIQLGGIGVITFATFLALFLSESVGVSHRHILQDVVSESDVSSVTRTLKHIVAVAFTFEILGAISYYISWVELIPSPSKRVFFAVFHSVSAFCNAGFSLFTNSFADSSNALAWDINLTTMILIVGGGLGFTTIWELVQRSFPNRSPVFRGRLSVHSLIAIRMTIGLIIAGTLFIMLLEWNGVLSSYSLSEKFLLSLFQSVTTRTAGFNTLDFGAFSTGTTLIVIVLMSIGGSPASTAGGLKTTTIYILFSSMLANIKGKNRLEIANRTIPNEVVFKAITSVFLAFISLISCTIILAIYEPFNFIDLLFEQVSAFMTVGVSRGITADLSSIGKSVLIFSMFAGRVGLLTFAFAFAKKVRHQNYLYPEENVMVA